MEALHTVDLFVDGNGDIVDSCECTYNSDDWIKIESEYFEIGQHYMLRYDIERLNDYYSKCPFVCDHGKVQ